MARAAMTRDVRLPSSLLVLALCRHAAAAQQEASSEQLAPVLAAEDARNFQPDLFRQRLVSPDSLVRRMAALSAGPDRRPARHASGAAAPRAIPTRPSGWRRPSRSGCCGTRRRPRTLMDRLTGVAGARRPTAVEAVTALAKIGGAAVGELLRGSAHAARRRAHRRPTGEPLTQVVCSSPGGSAADAPVGRCCPSPTTPRSDAAGARPIRSAGCGRPRRETASRCSARPRVGRARASPRGRSRGATRKPPDSRRATVGGAARPAPPPTPDPQVKINAIRSLAGYRDSALATDILPLLDDPLPNVQVQAATTAGRARGRARRSRALARVAAGKGPFALRREALSASLARTPRPSRRRPLLAGQRPIGASAPPQRKARPSPAPGRARGSSPTGTLG